MCFRNDQELSGAKAYEETSDKDKSSVFGHRNYSALNLFVNVKDGKISFIRCIGYLSFIKIQNI